MLTIGARRRLAQSSSRRLPISLTASGSTLLATPRGTSGTLRPELGDPVAPRSGITRSFGTFRAVGRPSQTSKFEVLVCQTRVTGDEVEAVEASDIEWLSQWGSTPRGLLFRSEELVWFVSGLPAPSAHVLSGAVIRTNLPWRAVDAAIGKMADEFRSRGLPLKWVVGPSSRPDDLGDRLEAAGLRLEGSVVGMAVELATLPEHPSELDEFVISSVETASDLRQFCTVVNTAYLGVPAGFERELPQYLVPRSERFGERSRIRMYLGYWKGDPVATAHISTVGRAAGLHLVSTVPHARRRGFGQAITAWALRSAKRSGAKAAILTATRDGAGIYSRLGFHEVCEMRDYHSPSDL